MTRKEIAVGIDITTLIEGDVAVYDYYFAKTELDEYTEKTRFVALVTDTNTKNINMDDVIKLLGDDSMSDGLLVEFKHNYTGDNDFYVIIEVLFNTSSHNKEVIKELILKHHPQYFI